MYSVHGSGPVAEVPVELPEVAPSVIGMKVSWQGERHLPAAQERLDKDLAARFPAFVEDQLDVSGHTGIIVLVHVLETVRIGRDRQGTGAEGAVSGTAAGQDTGIVNLNTAGVEELMTLPGIGQKRAEDIVAYRQMNGGFSSVEELTNISGIGNSMLAKLNGRITV